MSISEKICSANTTDGISIVVPFLNEEEGIVLFCKTIDDFAMKLDFPIEIVFVNDGSSDNTEQLIYSYIFHNIKSIKLITLSKNFGSHAAIRAGLTQASFKICTWVGSDLQEPLELLPLAYQKIQEGFQAIYVEKKTIKVSKINRSFSKIYSYLMQKYAVKNYSSGGISTIVFGAKVKDFLNQNIESNSSIILQIIDAGFKHESLYMDFHARSAGVSKWTFAKKIKLFIDSFVAFSFAPIRLVSIIGIIMCLLGLLIGVVAVINKIISPTVPMGYSTLLSIIALGFGITNVSLGIIAEYLWRTYDAARKRPTFIIENTINLKSQKVNND